ncbi:4Fe-4S ferredoxin [Planosporangium thailandense]|uniref:4Fe-4S ferredoxin n=1 Tax=Planosporangium thailandense TaxID=765197 RepID=A0ABX0Y4W9_9ACTN|nr:4Fe-4S dicluster domain-containing protein [Planosporangium thailandense]NJC72458.1 4Fe-4S ferredoxin [Planosporangium thailandense]
MPVLLTSLDPLVAALRADGYRVVGPTVRDGAIVLAELDRADMLPYGWGVRLGPGGYRLRERDDRAAFANSAGPQSWKQFLHPPRQQLWSAERDSDGGFTVAEPADEPPRYAFLGVRPCDLRAISVLDHVLGAGADNRYARRREGIFIVVANCTEPGETCFCVSAGGGPGVGPGHDGAGYDLALTELADDDGVRYVVDAGSEDGWRLLDRLPYEAAEPPTTARARDAVARAADRMGRTLPAADLRALLAGTLEAARWDDVAARCLSCGNCTMVCPTCFCTSVEDTTDLTGDHAERWLRWESCFDLDFSYLHGGPVRSSRRSRYRQWLTHKLGTWHDQFGESGCVGCGRCIVWCPVGIDITEETHALAAEYEASTDDRGGGAQR